MDETFTRAVALLDSGDLVALASLIDEHPRLVRERTDFGTERYFLRPFLLWFVAENPVRNDRLPPNIADVARLLIAKGADQVDYALALVSSGRVAREHGVQRALIDVLCEAGAHPDGAMTAAVAHHELEAVDQLLARGARETLIVSAALGRPFQADGRDPELQAALTAAAFYGNASAVEELVAAGADCNAFSPEGFHPHATPLHQAVFAGSLDCVRALVSAGARLDIEDRVFHSTPLGWADYLGRPEIAEYLRGQEKVTLGTGGASGDVGDVGDVGDRRTEQTSFP
jgi:peptide-methionine (S)-S-oxide reductase